MKKYFVILALALASCNQNANKQQNISQDSSSLPTSLIANAHTANGLDTTEMERMPTLDFSDTLHNFGTINEGETVEYDFPFKNNGKSPLLISGALGSCGCTVADYPQNPILPGKGGILKVKFNTSGKSGHQEKSVEINSNSRRGNQYLYIQADVTASKN